jgi:alkanesulfonate monooxygenase SsuD/methylene tetrahydromethanopterin reductase-like flavin-dependent oxidoreductase (luciferase family)
MTGRAEGVPSPEEAQAYQYQLNERAFMRQYERLCADGTPQQVKEKLEEIAELYQTSDLSVVTICHGFADRVRSYELVAEACGITK